MLQRTAHIALVNTHHGSRVATVKALHKLGFQHVAVCKTTQELEDRLMEQKFDWVLAHPLEDHDHNLFRYLSTFYETHALPKTFFSFILSQKQQLRIPTSFSHGLLSWFEADRFEEQKSIENEILEFIDTCMKNHQKNLTETYTAAHYLRRFLRKAMIWDELVKLETLMCNAYPLHYDNLFLLAEAHFSAGDFNKGREVVQQAQQVAPEVCEAQIENLMQKFPKALLKKQGSLAERFNIGSVIVIERDEHEVQVLRAALKRIGITDFKHYTVFQKAWAELKNAEEPDLIIAEWNSTKRQNDISAMQFLQRIRGHGFHQVPLAVLVSQLRPQEAQLLNDLGTLQLLHKPLREDPVVMALAFAIQQAKQPTERRPMEQKIIQSLQDGNRSYAYHMRKVYLGDKNTPPSRKHYIEALFLYHQGEFEKARNLLIKALKLAVQEKSDKEDVKPSLEKTVLLAKCLFQLGDKTLAVQMLEKAKLVSPFNINIRLALMEMNYDLGNLTQATAAIEEAEKIDGGNSEVIEAGAKLSLLTGRTEQASHFFSHMENHSEIITRMNNQAVSFIQAGEFQRGIDLYQSAIKALPKDEKDLLGVVHYNLALAYLRHDDIAQCIKVLQVNSNFQDSRVQGKAAQLSKRLQESLAAGKKIKYNAMSTANRAADNQKLLGLMSNWTTPPQASIALMGLYHAGGRTPAASADDSSPTEGLSA